MRSSDRDRQQLDHRLARWREVPATVPPRGWIRAIRDALGMPLVELGRRLGITPQAVAQIETSEADGSIRLATLRRAASALDCTLIYALVPNESLEASVDRRARHVAARDTRGAHQTMLLEDQLGGSDDQERLLDELAERAKQSPGLWRG